MKKTILAAALIALGCTAMAQSTVHRNGYVTKNGTYVAPSYATSPNETKLDNFSTRGNVNPYTGKAGTVNPYATGTSSSNLYKPAPANPYATPRLKPNPFSPGSDD